MGRPSRGAIGITSAISITSNKGLKDFLTLFAESIKAYEDGIKPESTRALVVRFFLLYGMRTFCRDFPASGLAMAYAEMRKDLEAQAGKRGRRAKEASEMLLCLDEADREAGLYLERWLSRRGQPRSKTARP